MDYTIPAAGFGPSRIVPQLLNLISWLVLIFIGIIIGTTLISGTLTVPFVPIEVTNITGWVLVLLTILAAILSIINRE